jgi:hypothetical protein
MLLSVGMGQAVSLIQDSSVVIADSGNVGIGTSSPSSKLQVNGGIVTNSGGPSGDISAPAASFFYDTSNDFASITSLHNAVAWKPFAIRSAGMIFRTSSDTEAMRIDSSGNVGIGTASPSALLDVDGTTRLGGAVSVEDNEVTRPKLKDYSETTVIANTGTTYTIDLENGNVFNLTLTGNCTYTFSNPPASGSAGAFTLIQNQDGTGSRSVTWPASVEWAGGSAPTITSTASSTDVFTFITTDGGTTWYGFTGGQDFS